MTTEQLDPLEYMTKIEKDFVIYYEPNENSREASGSQRP